jgi:hypothetical protein
LAGLVIFIKNYPNSAIFLQLAANIVWQVKMSGEAESGYFVFRLLHCSIVFCEFLLTQYWYKLVAESRYAALILLEIDTKAHSSQ